MSAIGVELPAQGAAGAWQKCAGVALFALGGFLPWSTAGTSIAIAALAVLYLAAPRRAWAATPWREPAVIVGLLLLAWIALRTLAADGASARTASFINHYHELLVIPLLAAVMRLAQRRHWFLLGLVVGALGLALASWIPLPEPAHTKMAIRRISLGFGLSVCAFVIFEETRTGRWARRIGYAMAGFLALTVLIALGARTGYVVLVLLGACAWWRAAPARWRLPGVAALVVAAAVAGVLLAPVIEQRGDIAKSNQIRGELLHNTLEVVHAHWGVGVGWAGYETAYAASAAATGAKPGDLWSHTDNPHNEYLMQLAGGGLPALGLFLAWLALPMLAGWRRRGDPDPQAGLVACVALAFAVGCVFNSMLLDFTEGHLYAGLFAWWLARRDPASA